MAEVLARDVSYRVDFTGSGASAIRKYQVCSNAGEKTCDLMDASTAAQHKKPAGIAQIEFPYVGTVYDPGDPLRPVTDKTVTSDPGTVGDVAFGGLKGKVTLKKRGGTWAMIEVAFGGTLVEVAPGDMVIPSTEIDGAVVKAADAPTAGDERMNLGVSESDVYEEPGFDSAKWASNQVTVPASAPDPNNIGYIFIATNIP